LLIICIEKERDREKDDLLAGQRTADPTTVTTVASISSFLAALQQLNRRKREGGGRTKSPKVEIHSKMVL